MANYQFFKYLDSQAPNLSLQENTTQMLLWGTAGRLGGLFVTDVQPNISNPTGAFDITLSAGSFIHNGLVVNVPSGATITLTKPTIFSAVDTLNLIAQSNGPEAGADPIWSLASGSFINSQTDPKNYAAVIAIYYLKLDPSSLETDIGMTGDGVVLQWTASVAVPHWQILNSGAVGSYLSATGSTNRVDEILAGNLPSTSATIVTSAMLTVSVAADYVGAGIVGTTNGTVVVGGAPTGLIGDRFSMYADGVEVFYDSIANNESFITIANGLRTAILASSDWSLIATPNAPGSATIVLTSVQKGHAANFNLQATTTSTSGPTITATVQPSGGAQAYLQVDFPMESGGTTAAPAILIYPPISAGTPTNNFVDLSFPLDFSSVDAATFNSMRLRLTSEGPALTGLVYIRRALLTVQFAESNDGIDPNPPFNLFHWLAGPNVSVGGGDGTSLSAHRLLNPIDHPDRSITRKKIRFRAVGPQEISAQVVGAGFVEGFHTPTELLTPWLITGSDLTLEETSDAAKKAAYELDDVPSASPLNTHSGLVPSMARDHNNESGTNFSGHHRPSLIADITGAETTTSFQKGMRVVPLPAGDPAVDGVNRVTGGQSGVVAASAPGVPSLTKSLLTAVRFEKNIPLAAGGTADIQQATLFSPDQATAGEIALGVSLDPAHPFVRASQTADGAKPHFGISAVNNIPAQGLINNEVTLFEGWIVFTRTDTATWNPRVSGAARFFPDAAFGSAANADSTGVMSTLTNSFLPDSPSFGAAYYADFGSTDNFGSGESNSPVNSVIGITANGSYTKIATGLGYFPTPKRGINASYTTLDASSGSEWLYLPFPRKDIFGSVSISAAVFAMVGSTETSNNLGGLPDYGAYTAGIMAAPAYDAREVYNGNNAFALVAPSFAPAPGAFGTKSTGVVRRQPWVLTPYGLAKRIGFSGGTEDSYYYDPRNGSDLNPYDPYTFFTRPLTDYATTLGRTTNFLNGAPNITSSDSFAIQGALPYYDRRRSGDASTPVTGIVMNAAQINAVSAFFPFTTFLSNQWGYVLASSNVTVPLLKRYTADSIDSSRQALLTPGGGGGGSTRTPDGIAVCAQRWDFGIAGKNLVTAGVAPYSGTSNDKFVEAPIAIHLKITGTLLDRLKLALSL